VLHSDQTTAVTVRFAPRVAKAAAAARVVAGHAITQFDDGGIEITYEVADVDELARWVLSWGAQAEIVAPPAARERIGKLSREIAQIYAGK